MSLTLTLSSDTTVKQTTTVTLRSDTTVKQTTTLTLSSDTTVKHTTTSLKKPTIYTNKNKFMTGSRTTNPKTFNAFPAEFLRRIAEKMAKTLSLVTIKRSSRKVSSSATLARSRSYADTTLDTHRAEAVSDCIEFLNSSSVLRKCNSIS